MATNFGSPGLLVNTLKKDKTANIVNTTKLVNTVDKVNTVNTVNTINNKKTKKNNNLVNEPELIGKGGHGCVFKPAFKCKKGCPKSNNRCSLKNKNVISKVIDESEKESENYKYLKIHKIDPDETFHIKYPIPCEPLDEDIPKIKEKCDLEIIKKPLLQILSYGGFDLYKLIEEKKTSLNVDDFNNFLIELLKKLENILKALRTLNLKEIYHLDIKLENIVNKNLNSNSNSNNNLNLGVLKLIDFGLAYTPDKKKTKKTKKNNDTLISLTQFNGEYFAYPLYTFLMSLNSRTKEDLDEFIKNFIKNSHIQELIDFYIKNNISHNKNSSNTLKKENLFETFLTSLVNQIIYLSTNSSYQNIILKSIDMYSFGIIVLNIYNTFNNNSKNNTNINDKINKIKNKINDFLVNSNILSLEPFYENDESYDNVCQLYSNLLDEISTINTNTVKLNNVPAVKTNNVPAVKPIIKLNNVPTVKPIVKLNNVQTNKLIIK